MRRPKVLWANALLLLITFAVYSPSLRGRFLWDDDAHVSRNAALTSVEGLRQIWLKPGAVQQYYPVTYTTFWIEYHLWGLTPEGYHIANILLHGVNAILLGILLTRLGMPGAWMASWLFALHPVQVESVAWISELKNVLSTFFYLWSALFLLKSERANSKRMWHTGTAALLLLCALLSKSVTATLPISFLVIGVWMKGQWDTGRFRRLWPLLALSAGVGFFTLHMEHNVIGAQGELWNFSIPARILIAGRAFWFYLGTLFYPYPLVFIYPRWSINPQDWALYLFPLATVALGGILAYGRRWWGKIPFACFLFFTITLGPALGFVNIYPMRFSFVADHFQYLASLGLFTLVGWASARLLHHLKLAETSAGSLFVIGLLCANLSLATYRQAGHYIDSMHLWEHTLAFNPDSAIAHHNLGIALSEKGEWNLAVAHLRTAEALDPTFAQTHLALAYFAVNAKRWEDARHQYQEAIRLGIHDPQILKDFAALPK